MADGSVSIRYFILGLLTRRSMTGYDIKSLLESLVWLIDVPSFGSLYPALHALHADDMVTVDVVPNQGKPPRKIYSITPKGRRFLQEWLQQPAGDNVSLKDFAMRLILAHNFSPAGLIDHLNQRRAQVAAYRATLEQLKEEGDDQIEDFGYCLVVDYGLAIAEAELTWLDNTLARLLQQSLSVSFLVDKDEVSTLVA